MSKVYILLANGFEEIEGLMVVDLMRRAGIDIKMVSITDSLDITGARGIGVKADITLKEAGDDADMVVLPGGMPGTTNLKNDKNVETLIMDQFNKGRYVAAICAAPTVFGTYGILDGKKATCYPGCEEGLGDVEAITDGTTVVVDGNIITSRGMGTAIDFSLKLIEILKDKETADKIGISVVYNI